MEELEFFLSLFTPISGNVPTTQVMPQEMALSQVLSKGWQVQCNIAPKKLH